MRTFLKKIIPAPLFHLFQPAYHFLLAFVGALKSGFPSRKIHVVGITGTKGKTTTTELVNAILEEAGYKTAIASTLRFKIGNKSDSNLFKMTMPGRFFLQEFIRKAVNEHCDTLIVEMTSEGAKQFRHRFIELDALIFTNIAPEHIESHGSFEKYKSAKLSIVRQLERSKKKNKALIVNGGDKYAQEFLNFSVPVKKRFALKDTLPTNTSKESADFTYSGLNFSSHLAGRFNTANILASITYAQTRNISLETAQKALKKFQGVPGRVEYINEGQPFKVVVDYAHTPDSLEKLYESYSDRDIFAVLGNAGGGRDKWKRPEMGAIADRYCTHIVLTDEDPYDEDPREIVEQMHEAITKTPVEITMDRREAIHSALTRAKNRENSSNAVVLITGKGTDPFIMGPNDTREPWDDARVAREELRVLMK